MLCRHRNKFKQSFSSQRLPIAENTDRRACLQKVASKFFANTAAQLQKVNNMNIIITIIQNH